MTNLTYSDLVYTSFRDAIIADTKLHEAFDATEVFSGGNSFLDKCFILDITRKNGLVTQNSSQNYYLWNIVVKLLVRRQGNITTSNGTISSDKSTLLNYDHLIVSAFYRAFDFQGTEINWQPVEANYLFSTTPKINSNSPDYLYMEINFQVDGMGDKYFLE